MNTSLLVRGAMPVQLDRTRLVFFDKQATFLLMQKFPGNFRRALYTVSGDKDAPQIELVDPDNLQFFLWAGLRVEAEAAGDEPPSLEQVDGWLTPVTMEKAFYAVVFALSRGVDMPGKPQAVPAQPTGPGPRKQTMTRDSITQKRNDSRTASSTKRRRNSGPKR